MHICMLSQVGPDTSTHPNPPKWHTWIIHENNIPFYFRIMLRPDTCGRVCNLNTELWTTFCPRESPSHVPVNGTGSMSLYSQKHINIHRILHFIYAWQKYTYTHVPVAAHVLRMYQPLHICQEPHLSSRKEAWITRSILSHSILQECAVNEHPGFITNIPG